MKIAHGQMRLCPPVAESLCPILRPVGGSAGELLELEVRVDKQLASNTTNRLAKSEVIFSKKQVCETRDPS